MESNLIDHSEKAPWRLTRQCAGEEIRDVCSCDRYQLRPSLEEASACVKMR